MRGMTTFALLTFLVQFFSPALEASCGCSGSNRTKSKIPKGTADYVVVGVGTAGALMAKRLTDDKETSVIALHIGKDLSERPLIKYSKNAVITVPAAIIGPPLYENGLTTPQTNADNRELLWAFALPEGGASSVNAGAYCRGTNEVYSQWEAIAGPQWSVARILKIFKQLETYKGETTNPATRGKHGPLNVLQVADPSEVSIKFTNATIAAANSQFVLDYNDPFTPIGVSSQLQYTFKGKNGRLRESSVTAFLNEDVVTPNGRGVDGRRLRILFESRGLRTIWKGNKAVGVEYLHNGKIKQVFAKKGVIVCCGLMSSPFLLHSGVGPQSLLESLGIPVIFNNPNVGQGLADQPALRMLFSSNPADTSAKFNGLFAQISWLPAPGGDPNKREIRFATLNVIPGFTLLSLDLCQPRSRGSVSITSPDPSTDPSMDVVVDLGDLSNNEDLELFRAAMQVYLKNLNTQLQLTDPLYQLLFPDPAILDDATLVDAFIRENVACNQHFQSHCRMAPLAQGGVVDSTGHVHGVRNLIVADDSIVPLCMDGSPMASAYLIAENIARLLIQQK